MFKKIKAVSPIKSEASRSLEKIEQMNKKFTGYENGEKSSIGPSKEYGGYSMWNWCGKCTAVWDKNHWRCELCGSKLRAKSRYISRRKREKKSEL